MPTRSVPFELVEGYGEAGIEQARIDIVNAMAPLLHALDAVAARLEGDTAAVVISYLRDVAEVHRDHSTSARRRPY